MWPLGAWPAAIGRIPASGSLGGLGKGRRRARGLTQGRFAAELGPERPVVSTAGGPGRRRSLRLGAQRSSAECGATHEGFSSCGV
jgi:hypothetical protein